MTDHTQTPDQPTPRSGTPKWVKVLLAASLALNLMVLGLVCGTWFSEGPLGRSHGPREVRERVDPAMGPFGRVLPEPYRERAQDSLRDRAGTFGDNRAVLAAQLTEMISLLRSDDFDEASFRALMEAQSAFFTNRSDVGREVVIEQITTMSLEERETLAGKLEKGFGRVLGGGPRDQDRD
ncbi:periplasmic heavy metal sensor [uncultured Maritimibacter sp.]|jgi:uncharacterized membrane protein|uniref:periplasmic heavy metal sensor n=1 Tax=uncultured Maritimibacter sp. TaxID=991866 RepID=UPI0026330512|nr:periplasmic heavy metal sensor [uncultured Maritimibacter sp.]